MISFKQFLNGFENQHQQIKKHFLINDKYVMETLDSSYKILDKRHQNGADEYLVQTESKKYYKIYVEELYDNDKLYIDVGFLRHINNKWEIRGIINDLTSTELLKLFGTLKVIALKYNPDRIYIGTQNEPQKMIKYMKILNRINIPGYTPLHDKEDDFCLCKDYKNDKSFIDNVFLFKSKFKKK